VLGRDPHVARGRATTRLHALVVPRRNRKYNKRTEAL
jgi:hypothetical protein